MTYMKTQGRRAAIFTIGLALSLAMGTAASVSAHVIEEEKPKAESQINKPIPRLHVNGTGVSFQEPDTAHVSAGVVASGLTAEEAMKENAAKMDAAIKALLAAGVKRKHIQTSGLNLRPIYNHTGHVGISPQMPKAEPRKIISYEIHNMVSAKTYDLDNVGAMLDSLVKAGSNNINGVRFSLKDDSVAKAESRIEAIKDARNKAKAMAEGAGVTLGRILVMGEGVSYNNNYDEVVVTAQSGGGFNGVSYGGATPIQSGQQRITASVNMVFEIIQ